MTDWLPIVGVALVGIFTTLGLAGRALEASKSGEALDLHQARRSFWITVVVSAVVYALYLVFDEGWIWYS